MLFTILITVVFIAELIIVATLGINLIKLDNNLIAANNRLLEIRPQLKNIAQITKEISKQLVELAQISVDNFKQSKDRFLLTQLKSIVVGILFTSLNIKFLKRIRKNKIVKTVWKGFNILENMV